MTQESLEALQAEIKAIENRVLNLFLNNGGFEEKPNDKSLDDLLNLLYTADALLTSASDKIGEMLDEREYADDGESEAG